MTDQYPLKWPDGWPRTPTHQRKKDRYQVEVHHAVDELHRSLKLLGAMRGSVVISSNVPPRNALGTPRNDGTQVSDPGVSVWWSQAGQQRVVACDCWNSVRANIRAIGLAIDGLRAIDRAGASQILNKTFEAFGALPGAVAAAPPVRPWWDVLGIKHDLVDALSLPMVEARYRELAATAHADRGGSDAAMVELNRAIGEARAYYGTT